MRREPGLTPDDILLSVTTLSFDIAGLEIFLPITTGATVVIATRDTAADGNLLRKELETGGATVMQATPITWRLLLEAGWSGSQKLKILIGGEAVPRDLVNQLVPRCASLWNMYGPTETTIWSTTCRLTTGTGPVSIGRPIDNTQTYIVNAALQPQPIGVAGELLIGGDGVALGYLDRPDLTAEKFISDPFSSQPGARLYRTGDLARWLPDGTLECLGRLDYQVKIRGFRIELGDIETALNACTGIKQSVVVARDDSLGLKRLVAYIIPTGPNPPATTELRNALASRLPDYMVPAAFITLAAFPLTPNGKIDRKALPAPTDIASPAARESIAPRNDKEHALSAIWREVLGVPNVGVTDDFFELGGDSLLSFRISNRATQAGMALAPRMFFQHRTIADLARALETVGAVTSETTPTRTLVTRASRDNFRRKTS
jgi:acyl-CoA synthetase (AMP-forming)/AMP-acid ligase II